MDNALHHFVPQFYLRRFVDHNGLLWAYDKGSDRVFSTNPRNLAAQRGFYTLPDNSPDPSLMERDFRDLEKEAASITEDWLHHIEPGVYIEIPDVNREIMSLYITTQILRTSEARTLLIQGVMGNEAKSLEEGIQRELHIALLWNRDVVAKIGEWVRRCTWIFRFNATRESLYTSDDPFKVRSKTRHLYWAQISFEGTYILIPLTPRILMYCFDSRGWSKLKPLNCLVVPNALEPELVKDANIHQVGHAERFVFADQNDFRLARELVSKHPGAVSRHRQRFEQHRSP